MKLADAAQNAAADAVVDSIDVGAGTEGSVEIRSGVEPADADDVASGTLLATVSLANPAYGAAGAVTAGVADLLGTPLEDASPVASGTAGHFRVLDADGDPVFVGDIATSGADMNVNTTTVTAGVPFRINSGSYTHPAE